MTLPESITDNGAIDRNFRSVEDQLKRISILQEAPLNVNDPVFSVQDNPIQAAMDVASAAGVASGSPGRVVVPGGEWTIDNLDIPLGGMVEVDFTSSLIKPAAQQDRAFIYAAETLDGGSDYYGHYPYVSLLNGILDPNGVKHHAAFVRLLWMEDLTFTCKIVDYPPPYRDAANGYTGGDVFVGTSALRIGGKRCYVEADIQRGDYGEGLNYDGFDFGPGEDLKLVVKKIESGDDAIAMYMAGTASVVAQPEGIHRVMIEGGPVDSTHGNAFKVHVDSGRTGDGWKVTDVVCKGLVGHTGQKRNCGVTLYDANDGTAGAQIERIQVLDCDLEVGGADHDGVNEFAIWVASAADSRITGTFRANANHDAASLTQVYSRKSNEVDLSRAYFLDSTAWKGIDRDTSSTRLSYGQGLTMSPHAQKYVLFDDFEKIPVTTGDLPYGWTGYNGTDGSAAKPTIPGSSTAPGSATVNGLCRLVTGADGAGSLAANGSRLETGRGWRVSTGGLVMETRVKVPSTITNTHLWIGMTGQIGSLVTPATMGGSDVMTAVATNAVGFLYDTAADTDNWWGMGINASTGSKQDLGAAPSGGFYYILRIEVATDGDAKFFIDGEQYGGTLASAIDPTVAQIGPVVVAFSRTNASKTVDVDYIRVEGDRI